MKITLHPQRRDDTLVASVSGDTITLNSQTLDFTPLPDGATLPRSAIDCEWIAGDVQRIDGVLHIPLILPHGPEASEAARFPQPITVTSGDVEFPQ